MGYVGKMCILVQYLEQLDFLQLLLTFLLSHKPFYVLLDILKLELKMISQHTD